MHIAMITMRLRNRFHIPMFYTCSVPNNSSAGLQFFCIANSHPNFSQQSFQPFKPVCRVSHQIRGLPQDVLIIFAAKKWPTCPAEAEMGRRETRVQDNSRLIADQSAAALQWARASGSSCFLSLSLSFCCCCMVHTTAWRENDIFFLAARGKN